MERIRGVTPEDRTCRKKKLPLKPEVGKNAIFDHFCGGAEEKRGRGRERLSETFAGES